MNSEVVKNRFGRTAVQSSNNNIAMITRALCTAFVLVLLVGVGIASAAPVEEWSETFGGASTDLGYSVQQTSDGGYVDIGDVAKVAFMVAGKVPEELSADVNGNGYVDIGDAAKIAFYLAGKVGEL